MSRLAQLLSVVSVILLEIWQRRLAENIFAIALHLNSELSNLGV